MESQAVIEVPLGCKERKFLPVPCFVILRVWLLFALSKMAALDQLSHPHSRQQNREREREG